MTMRARVIQLLSTSGCELTATQLCHLMADVKLSSLSGLLCRMTNEGVLVRFENIGPRGGYGYALKENTC